MLLAQYSILYLVNKNGKQQRSVFYHTTYILWRRDGREVRAPELKSGGPGSKSRSDLLLTLFFGKSELNLLRCL